MTQVRDLRLFFADWCDRIEEAVSDVTIDTALWFRETVAQRTPIKTGRAAASWNLRVGAIDHSVAPLDYYNISDPWREGNIELRRAKLGTTAVYVSNSIGYIGRLNAGSSQQAPAGFIEATLEEAQRAATEAAKKAQTKHHL
jgi:hypothetical protein